MFIHNLDTLKKLTQILSSVGSPKHTKVMAGAVEGEFIGKRAEELRGLLHVKYPIEHGIVNDWEDMTSIWKTTYQELHVSSDDVIFFNFDSSFNLFLVIIITSTRYYLQKHLSIQEKIEKKQRKSFLKNSMLQHYLYPCKQFLVCK